MHNPLLLPELREMIAEGDVTGLQETLSVLHPATVAEFAEGLSVEETWKLLENAPTDRQTEVFGFFPTEKQVDLIHDVGRDKTSRLIEQMPHDERVHLLKQLDDDVVESLLPLVAKADRQDIRLLLSYPDHSAGSVMTTDYATLPPDITVANALTELRHQAPTAETIYYIYVVDPERKLLGFVSLHDLILAKPTAVVGDIMQRRLITVPVTMDREEVANEMAKYDFLAMPVVDQDGKVVGIVTHDDVIDVVVKEATEDALRMAGVGAMEENYLEAPIMTVWKKRTVWLACLFGAELLTFTAMAHFDDEMKMISVLGLFIPLCISTGGNSGSQAATLITRSLVLGHVSPRNWRRVLSHELLMGVMLGLTLGAIGFLRASVTPENVLHGTNRWLLALVIAQSVAAICLCGTLVGAMLPLAFKRMGFDPGYASSPFVATFVDVTGIIIFFSIAKVFLL